MTVGEGYRHRLSRLLWILILFLKLLTLALIGGIAYNLLDGSDSNLRGHALGEATKIAGTEYTIYLGSADLQTAPLVRSNEQPKGTILFQTDSTDGTSLTVGLSGEENTAVIPNVTGKDELQATEALVNAGLSLSSSSNRFQYVRVDQSGEPEALTVLGGDEITPKRVTRTSPHPNPRQHTGAVVELETN